MSHPMNHDMTLEEWAEKIADDIVRNPHSYQKHCQTGRELMQLDGSPITRDQYHDLIKRSLMDPKAQGRVIGDDKSTLALYSHETKMVVVVRPRMTGDASTAYPLSGKPPLKVDHVTDIVSHAQAHKSIHNNVIYNHGDGFPSNAREAFQGKFECRDREGRYTGRSRTGEPVKPITGPEGPFAAWLQIRTVPQKLTSYFHAHASPDHARAPYAAARQGYRGGSGQSLH